MEQHDLLTNDLLISNASQANLNAAARWGKFLSIAGFIGCGLTAISGIYLQTVVSSYSVYASSFPKYVGIMYIILSIILFIPCLFLNKFSNKILEAIRSYNQESLDSAFMNLRSMFKFYGIFTIVILIFVALAFLGGLSTMFR